MKEQLHHIGINYEAWQIAFHGDRGTIRVVTFGDMNHFVNSTIHCRAFIKPNHIYRFNESL